MSIESKFYICSSNKIVNSDIVNNYPELCDGWKVNWTPDNGFLGCLFNKQTEYTITFNEEINFDLIKFYFLPPTDYYWGTRQKQEREQYDGLQIKILYTTNDIDWEEITSNEAICINNYFGLNNKPYDISRQAWNLGFSAEVLFLKLNTKIENAKKIKFILNWSDPDISNWGITELEIKETKEIQAKDFNLDTERKILNNTLNDTKIIINTYDLDYSIYNFIEANCEIFGYIYKDNAYQYFSNLIISEANVNIEQRILSLVLNFYSENYFTSKVNYNTPILYKKSYYTLSHCIELLLLQANIPQYFVNFYYGYFTYNVYYPNIEMTIKEELNDFLKSNLNIELKRDFKNYFTIYNHGTEYNQIISQTSDNYIEFNNGFSESNNILNPVIFAKIPFNDDTFLTNFFKQDFILQDNITKVYEKRIKTTVKRKTKRYIGFKTVDKRIEYEEEKIEQEVARDKQRFKNLLLLDFPKGKKNGNDYYNTNNISISTQEIKINCLTVPYNQSAMYCQTDIYLSQGYETQTIPITQPDKIIFKYKDIRGEQTLTFQVPTKTVSYPNTNLTYGGDGNNYYFFFRIKLYLYYSGMGAISIGFYNRHKITNSERIIWGYSIDPTMTDGAFLRTFMTQFLSGYTTGLCEMTITCNKNIQKTGYQFIDYKINGLYLSGIARKYGTNNFTLTNCLDVNIREWNESEFYNLLAINNNITAETYYRLLDKLYLLNKKQYNLDKLTTSANGNLYFIYVLKNVYPYSSYGKLWYIKSITHTNLLTYNKYYGIIDKYSKSLSYTKTLNNLDYENIVSKLSFYKNNQITEKKEEEFDILLNQNEILEKTINLNNEYILIGETIFDLIINNKVYSFYAGSGTLTETNINLSYEFLEDLHSIYFKITNNSSIKLEAKLEISYNTFSFEGIKENKDYTDLQSKYGILEYELSSGQLMLNTQIWFIYKFLEQYYNLQTIFNNNDIVFDNDLNIQLNNYNIKIEDRYINKYLTIEPYYINHYINENLYSETAIRGKIITEEDII